MWKLSFLILFAVALALNAEKHFEAPTNFEVVETISETTAMFSWEPVSGSFKNYKIQTWAEGDEANIKEILMNPDTTTALINKLTPFSVNYARIMVFNDGVDGPPSQTIKIKTSEGNPGPVQSFQALPLGPSAFLLQWEKPLHPNGDLRGYQIYYSKISGFNIGIPQERKPRIFDPELETAKLAGLEPNTQYRISILGVNDNYIGEKKFIEQRTASVKDESKPGEPGMDITLLEGEGSYSKVKITWKPNVSGNSGSYFYSQYRKAGEPEFQNAGKEKYELFQEVGGFDKDTDYEFRVISVDGEHETPSNTKLVRT